MSTARPELSRQRLAAEHLHKAEASLHVASLLLLDDTERTPEQRALFADVRRAVTFAGTRMAEERAKLLCDGALGLAGEVQAGSAGPIPAAPTGEPR